MKMEGAVATMFKLLVFTIGIHYSTHLETIAIVEVMRHGERGPIRNLSLVHQKWIEEAGYGQLTKKGCQNLEKNGKDFYKANKKIIDIAFSNSTNHWIRSTKKNRTLNSASCYVRGMLSDSNYNKTKVNIDTVPLMQDRILLPLTAWNCNGLKTYEKIKIDNKKFFPKESIDKVLEILKLKLRNISDNKLTECFWIADYLYADENSNPQSQIIEDSKLRKDYLKIKRCIFPGLASFWESDTKMATDGSVLASKILQVFKRKIYGNGGPVYTLYSGHDSSLLPLIHLLGITSWKEMIDSYFYEDEELWRDFMETMPQYRSRFTFQLLRKEGTKKYNVKVLFDDYLVSPKEGWDLSKFEEILSENGYDPSWTEKCGIDYKSKSLSHSVEEILWLNLLGVGLIAESVVVLLVLTRVIIKK